MTLQERADLIVTRVRAVDDTENIKFVLHHIQSAILEEREKCAEIVRAEMDVCKHAEYIAEAIMEQQ